MTFGYGTAGPWSVCPGTAVDSSTWAGLTYEYQYSSAGQTTGKRMTVSRNGYYGLNQINLDAYWTYDNEGKVLTTQYPVVDDPNSGNPTSTAYTYTYDTMGRASTMTNGLNSPYDYVVNGLQYNPSDQMLQISYGLNGHGGGSSAVSESRAYNSLNQVTSISTNQGFSEQYVLLSESE